MKPFVGICGVHSLVKMMPVHASTTGHIRVFKCLFRCVVRVNLAGQRGQNFVCGRVGMLPLWERILDTLPFLEILLPVEAEAAVLVLAEAEGSSGMVSSGSWGGMGSPDMVMGLKDEGGRGGLYDARRISSRKLTKARLPPPISKSCLGAASTWLPDPYRASPLPDGASFRHLSLPLRLWVLSDNVDGRLYSLSAFPTLSIQT